MAEYPVLPKAPLTEALVDIHVVTDNDLRRLAAFNEGIEHRFPTRSEWRVLNVFQGPQAQVQADAQPWGTNLGYRFESRAAEQPDRVVLARMNGFTFSRLWGYDDWHTFSTEAKELWERYVSLAKPSRVTRVALRYINRIQIPWPFKDFEEYFLTVPRVAPAIDKGLSGYLMQLQLPQSDSITAVVTQVAEPITPETSTASIVFDIDVFQTQEHDPLSGSVWELCERLRNIKNSIFFESITPRTRELFE
jgi:uncharacterized protein (TIGR04255 family)